MKCDYCGTEEIVYELESDRGPVYRCVECLAVEQIQQQVSLPFDAWLDQDDIEPMDHPDAPNFDPFDPREHDYKTVRAWSTILARFKDDSPLLKHDDEDFGTIFEDTREFVARLMGSDAHKRPSELRKPDP